MITEMIEDAAEFLGGRVDDLQSFLDDVAALGDETAPTPGDELALLLAGTPVASQVQRVRPLRRPVVSGPVRVRRRLAGLAAAAVAGLSLTGAAAFANELPSPVQRAVAHFSEAYLPFDFPRPVGDAPAVVPDDGGISTAPGPDAGHDGDAPPAHRKAATPGSGTKGVGRTGTTPHSATGANGPRPHGASGGASSGRTSDGDGSTQQPGGHRTSSNGDASGQASVAGGAGTEAGTPVGAEPGTRSGAGSGAGAGSASGSGTGRAKKSHGRAFAGTGNAGTGDAGRGTPGQPGSSGKPVDPSPPSTGQDSSQSSGPPDSSTSSATTGTATGRGNSKANADANANGNAKVKDKASTNDAGGTTASGTPADGASPAAG
ncbi:MAG: hypothetical protein ABIQ59_15500 [Nocardioidaceae bacterium]